MMSPVSDSVPPVTERGAQDAVSLHGKSSVTWENVSVAGVTRRTERERKGSGRVTLVLGHRVARMLPDRKCPAKDLESQ